MSSRQPRSRIRTPGRTWKPCFMEALVHRSLRVVWKLIGLGFYIKRQKFIIPPPLSLFYLVSDSSPSPLK